MRTRTLKTLTAPAAVLLGGLALAGCSKGIDPPEATRAILIEGGTFTMGSANFDPCDRSTVRVGSASDETRLNCNGNEQSEVLQTEVSVDGFCLDEHEVTILQYRHCVARGDCSRPRATGAGEPGEVGNISKYYGNPDRYDQFPVLGVAHEQAEAYCRYRGGRLPTEAEWEYAARSRGQDRATPWSDGTLAERCGEASLDRAIAFGDCSDNEPLAVTDGREDVTEQGIRGMGANAAEWVADRFDYLAYCDPAQVTGDARGRFFQAMENENQFPRPVDQGAPQISDMAGANPDFSDAARCIDAPSDDETNNTLEGGCADKYSFCALTLCPAAFGRAGEDLDRDEQQAVYEQRLCQTRQAVSVEGRPCLRGEDMDSNFCAQPDDPGTPVDCADFGYCECLTEIEPPSDSTRCLQGCFDEYRTCATSTEMACLEPDARVACVSFASDDITPAPVCRASGTSDSPADNPLIDEVRESELEGHYTVRGGHFQGIRRNIPCALRTTARYGQAIHSQTVGFRCAYDRGTEVCR